MTDKRQRATKVKCKCHESIKKTVNISRIYSSLEEAFEFCWSLFADEHKTLPKSTKRNVKSNKFAFGTLWLPDLLCKHWYTCASSIRNFCHWVADVLPCETSPVERSEEKRLFSQSIQNPRLWNLELSSRNPESLWRLESRIQVLLTVNPQYSTWNLESTALNPESKTVLDNLTWDNYFQDCSPCCILVFTL